MPTPSSTSAARPDAARSSSSAIALVWLVGLAFTLRPLAALALAIVAVAAGLTLGGDPAAAPRARPSRRCGSPRSASGSSTCCSRPSNGDPTATTLARPRPVPDHGRGGRGGHRARPAGRRDRGGRRRLHADDRLDAARRLARPAGHVCRRASRTARSPPTRPIPRFVEDLDDAPAGAPDPGPARRLAPAAARRPARPGDPPRRPDGAGDGRARLRLRAADRRTGSCAGPCSTWSSSRGAVLALVVALALGR